MLYFTNFAVKNIIKAFVNIGLFIIGHPTIEDIGLVDPRIPTRFCGGSLKNSMVLQAPALKNSRVLGLYLRILQGTAPKLSNSSERIS